MLIETVHSPWAESGSEARLCVFATCGIQPHPGIETDDNIIPYRISIVIVLKSKKLDGNGLETNLVDKKTKVPGKHLPAWIIDGLGVEDHDKNKCASAESKS